MRFSAKPEAFRLAETFTISRGSRDVADVLTVTVEDGDLTGWGECVPYKRYGETMDGVAAAVGALSGDIDRVSLQAAMAPGAARNAVDCALWDLEAKRAGVPAWQLAGLPKPGPVTTAYTLSLDTPEKMRLAAQKHAHRPLLKIKLGGEGDMARLEAVREGAPNTDLIVDANEGWTAEVYSDLAPHLVRLGVLLVEQPLPADSDDLLAEIERPLPVCADESCHDRNSLSALKGKYDFVNIKLDKTGGLTEALLLKEAALTDGFGIMVGCMVGTSLAMAPAALVAQGAGVVDLDGPLLLAEDRDHALNFDADGIHPPTSDLWG
ncbi:MAG: dipeptide epimerase [Boseongicola sp.]|nr:MAG: dipeptide epimerase [Boseongicola sp.]